ncbi:DNA/RNA helicase domain-containing protein [Gordonia sp. (in: high G+C Gram-positive bacteria)]|uniref:DNA/RNA helicase domain-containing protein n=1 Tax=Gordonia sp. (in: high G+C Gram-positive bacteria) TaxID=84139 RepID=UPI0039E2602B
MTLLRTTAADPRLDQPESLVEKLLEQMLFATGRRASKSEQASWGKSLPALATDLRDAGLSDVEMLIEYRLPLTSRRADVVLAGIHPETGAPSYVVVELKQWTSAHAYEGDSSLVDVLGMPGPPKSNPILQVRDYCDYIADFARAIEDQPDALAGVAYLHNATDPALVSDLRGVPVTTSGQLFTAAERGAFHEFLRSRLAPTSGRASADLLLKSHIAPSRQLLKVAADEVKNRSQFHLLGNQRVAVDLVLHQVEQARQANSKRVIVVTGGPGSGKSVVALELLGDLAREGRSVLHATGSRSFTQTLRKVAGYREPKIQKMFKYFNQFMAAETNGLDVLIMDEAHRIRETSAGRYTRAELRTDRPQIDELIAAAWVPVFLLDEHQIVRPGEMGSLEQITQMARERGLEVVHVELDAQFRCGGSEEYLLWVQRLLGLDDSASPTTWSGDPAFSVEVVDSPWELERRLKEKMEDGYSARITAGYCWPWSDSTKDGQLVPDVCIGDWARPWNVKGDRRVGDAPPSALWATDDGGFDQVGCIYTAQGFEYDWNGVIIGPDLVWRDGGFTAVRNANRDPDFKNRSKVSDPRFDRLVRHVYKVLLTRGMVGTVIYAVDDETRTALRALTGCSQQTPTIA